MRREAIVAMLAGGDRRSIGRANEVAALVLRGPRDFPELIGIPAAMKARAQKLLNELNN